MIDHALAYAAMGWPVFPLHTIKNGACTCGHECKKPGKHPRTVHGLKDATTDQQQISRWFSMWPDANIGIATGIRSGFWVLDIDEKSGGPEILRNWEQEHDQLPETVAQITGGGGEHYFFKVSNEYIIKSRVNLLKGIDVRGEGGYIVAPPSIHQSGSVYTWQHGCEPDTEMECLPLDTVKALGIIKEHEDPLGPVPTVDNVAQVLDAIPDDPEEKNKLFAALQILDVDDRDHWYKAGMALHSTGWADAFDLWCAWSMQSEKFNLSDSGRVWSSFNVKSGGLSLGSIYKLANDIAPDWNDGQNLKFVVTPYSQADQVLRGIQQQTDKMGPYRTISSWSNNVRLVPYLVKGLIPQRSLGYMFAPPKAKKTFAAIDIAAHICHGWEWCGHRVNRRKVLYISGEGQDSFINRLRGWSKANGGDDADLRGRLELLPQGVKIDCEQALTRLFLTIDDINQRAGDNQEDMIGLVVLDTLARTMKGNENAQQDMGLYVEACDKMRDLFGVATLVITHMSKGEGKQTTTRGSTVLPGAADFGLKVIGNQNELTGQVIAQDIKDGQNGVYSLEFEVINLGVDEEGDKITTLAVKNRFLSDEEIKNEKEPFQNKIIRGIVGRFKDGINITFLLDEFRNSVLKNKPEITPNHLRVIKSNVKKTIETNQIEGVSFDDKTGICKTKIYSII